MNSGWVPPEIGGGSVDPGSGRRFQPTIPEPMPIPARQPVPVQTQTPVPSDDADEDDDEDVFEIEINATALLIGGAVILGVILLSK